MDSLKSLFQWSQSPNPHTDGKIRASIPIEVITAEGASGISRVLSKNEPDSLNPPFHNGLDGSAEQEKRRVERKIVEINERPWDQGLCGCWNGSCKFSLWLVRSCNGF